MFDDSPTYLGTFSEIDTTYLHVINPDRKVYVTRAPSKHSEEEITSNID